MQITKETRRRFQNVPATALITLFNSNLSDYCGPDQGKFPSPAVSHRRAFVAILVLFFFMPTFFFGGTAQASVAEKPQIPAIGSGPYELYVFTDYFCGPCRDLEPELDAALRELLTRKTVKILFIDIPIHRQTVMFNRYFLYAARSGGDMLLIRKELFALAASRNPDEKKIISMFKKKKIAFKVFDLKPLYPEINRIIKGFNISSTPVCVVKYGPSDIRTYSGVSQIRNGLAVLRAASANKR